MMVLYFIVAEYCKLVMMWLSYSRVFTCRGWELQFMMRLRIDVVCLGVSTFSRELILWKMGKLYLNICQQCLNHDCTHDCCTIFNKRPRNYPTIYVSHIKITGKNIILLWVVKWKSPPLPMYFSSWNSYSKPHTWDGNVPRLFIFNLELLHSNLNTWNHQLAVIYN